MSRQTKDSETLTVVVNADLLDICEVGHYFKTPKRPTAYKNLYWWLHVNPNGDSSTDGGYLAVFIFTSIGGFEVEYSITIDRSDVKSNEVSYHDEPMRHGEPRLTTHKNLRSGDVIQDGEFTIQCKIKFTITTPIIQQIPNIIEDRCIIPLHHTQLETFKPGQNILTDKQTVNRITWYNDYFPCGYREDDKDHVSVFINIDGGPVMLGISFALSIGGVLIYCTYSHSFEDVVDNIGFLKCISHASCTHADQKDGIIEIVSIIAFDGPESSIAGSVYSGYSYLKDLLEQAISVKQNESDDESDDDSDDALEFNDNETIVVNTDLFNLCTPGIYFETVKRQTPCKTLQWWVRCYPNGSNDANKGYVSLFLHTSAGGFEMNFTFKVDRSNVRMSYDSFITDTLEHGIPKFVKHAQLHNDEIVKNGQIIIRCQVNFTLTDELLNNSPTITPPKIKDSCIVKLDRKKHYKKGHQLNSRKRTMDGITWWIQCYPCGKTKGESEHLSLCFHIDGKPSEVETTCGVYLGGVLLQKSNLQDSVKTNAIEFPKAFSHKFCERADHKNDVVNLLCGIQFSKPVQPLPQGPPNRTFEDQITITIPSHMFSQNNVSNSECTPLKFVDGSDKHQWQILYFAAGDLPRSRGHISLFIKMYTAETTPVTVSCAIKIVGTTFEKNYDIVVEKKSNFPIPKFISHKKLRRIGGIINNKVVIVCTSTFDTHLN